MQSLTPELDTAALEAVKQFAFELKEFDNKPAVVRIHRYTFTLEKAVVQTIAPTAKTGKLTGILFEKGTKTPLVGMEVNVRARAHLY